MDETHEKSLVEGTLHGDRGAFECLIDKYQRPLFNTAYRILGNREDAADVTQATFLKAYDKLTSFDDRHRFFSWIYRILVNESLNYLGKRKPVQALSENLVSNTRSPEDDCDARLLKKRLQSALRHLTPDYRTVITLRYFGELTYREISYALDIPEKTVKSRLFTARHRLLGILSRQGVRT